MSDLKKQVDRGLQGIREKYPDKSFQVSDRKANTNADAAWFARHPGVRERDRAYIPGEFDSMQLPDGFTLANIGRVHVMLVRVGGVWSTARIPIERS